MKRLVVFSFLVLFSYHLCAMEIDDTDEHDRGYGTDPELEMMVEQEEENRTYHPDDMQLVVHPRLSRPPASQFVNPVVCTMHPLLSKQLDLLAEMLRLSEAALKDGANAVTIATRNVNPSIKLRRIRKMFAIGRQLDRRRRTNEFGFKVPRRKKQKARSRFDSSGKKSSVRSLARD